MTQRSEWEDARESSRGDLIIRCETVRVQFGRYEALRGITIGVDSGEVVCVVGPSGSGKSTFLRTLNGLQPFNSGRIIINGIALPGTKSDLQAVRLAVGMVFQTFNLFPHLTVRENITLAPVTARGVMPEEARDRAIALLKRVGIAEQADKYPSQLSGGQQQRVAIARALAMDPTILLFDEPTSALDPEMIKEVLDVITELSHTGITMIVVTHEMGFARRVADRVVFMSEGQMLVDTDPDNFFSRPNDERLASFLAKVLY
jgi:general L-amino acid transport system ATP-binding protein